MLVVVGVMDIVLGIDGLMFFLFGFLLGVLYFGVIIVLSRGFCVGCYVFFLLL